MVAYEAFVLGNAAKADISDAKPRLHFQRLLEGAPDAFGFMMGRTEIEAFFSNAQAMLKGGIGNAPTRPAAFKICSVCCSETRAGTRKHLNLISREPTYQALD